MSASLRNLAARAWEWWRPKIGLREYAALCWASVRRHGIAWGVFLAAAAGVFVFSRFYSLHFNVSESLPHRLYLVEREPPAYGSLRRGDLVAWYWPGGLIYGKGARFLKIVGGLPGDRVEATGRCFHVRGRFLGCAKTHSRQGLPLQANTPGVVPEGRYYLYAIHRDSLDSRYAAVGYVPHRLIIGRAYIVW